MTSTCPQCGAFTKLPTEGLDLTTLVDPQTAARHMKLMQTNDPPVGITPAYLRDVLSKTSSRLGVLDGEISRLRVQLQQLEEEHLLLSDYHRNTSSILSPLRRVPDEIIAEIFAWTMPSPAESEGFDVTQSPWILGHISSHWRAIALSIPSLWSMVSIRPGSAANPLPMAELQLRRARNLKIHFYGDEDEDATEQLNLFNFLARHSAVWEELSIQLTTFLVPRLVALRGRLPLLRRLWIQWDREGSDRGVDSIQCFDNAPSLVDVGSIGESRFIPILLPAHQLTSYRVDGPWREHQSLLKAARNLVEARIVIVFDQDRFWPDADPIDMPHLQRLYVSDVSVLKYVRAPALSEIAMHLGREEDPAAEFDAFLSRSSCTPQRLCLTGLPSAVVCTELLKKHTFITRLALAFDAADAARDHNENEYDIYNLLAEIVATHLVAFTYKAEEAPVLPHLEELYFGVLAGVFLVDYPLFLDMLESRTRAGTSLCSAAFLTTKQRAELDDAAAERFDALESEGLSVWVESGARNMIELWMYACPWN
ncbi:hypothetical protein FB45DRAFT_945541 [Roridomyces roridus]|uniref:F-box domain-containing protein n=1 Tax=Roridomyces roridus TaxID=1738132 RepID=A0AAD7F8L0_9AGAR|nr:hypothetical protein FB45DRAFT_945076 [Roridomyces roridus]KAJ7609146.1 hypothetical protein FB45DRAFT_945541 [Roridomyces roridus]